MSTSRRRLLIVIIVLLGVGLRELAVQRLPLDYDEPVYYEASYLYAEAIRAGDLGQLVSRETTPEHPGLVKLLYAAVFLRHPPLPADVPIGDTAADAAFATWAADPANQTALDQINAIFLGSRRASALFGVLHVLLLALVSPAAGALLAVHTYTVKYTSQLYLEALPMLTASVAVLAYMRALALGAGAQGSRGAGEQGRAPLHSSSPLHPRSPAPLLFWWTLSAVALGLTAAGKYVYAVAGLAIAADYLWRWLCDRRAGEQGGWGAGEQGRKGAGEQGRAVEQMLSPAPLPPRSPAPLLPLLAWGALALLVFYAANPYLWTDPLGRLTDSILFHAAYSQGETVVQAGYPWWQPFAWLFMAQPAAWHPGAIVTPLDTVTAALGVIGLRPQWLADNGRGRVIVLWWGIGLLFLLLWSTKWPQYSLIMTAPMCLCAAEALRWLRSRLPEELWATAN